MGVAARARCWTIIAALLMTRAVAADPLADARKNVEDSDYLTARTSLESALKAGDASPDDLAEIYKLSGIVEGALGESDAATAAFSKWLSLDPKGALPVGTSPKIARPFTTASDQAKQQKPIEVKADTAAKPPTVTLVVASDPMSLITRARVIVIADGKSEQTIDGKPGIAFDLPGVVRVI